MKIVIAVLSALAFSASACHGPGERNEGAPGFPSVEYRPCCDGQAAVGKDGDWGKFCPGGGGGGDCYGPGERSEGAAGFPQVDYKPCCDGQAAVGKDGEWGKFCPRGGGGGGGGDCYGPGERNQGAAGFPAVDYKPCCDGQAAVDKAGDWGKFCPGGSDGGGDGDCYGAGQRNEGAPGFPAVEYKPCCDGQAAVGKDGDWGKFCPGGGGGGGGGGGDVDEGGVPYNPILCGSVDECGCSGIGFPRCSKCPDDGGSANVNNNVCWCIGVPGVVTVNECNPLKPNGPTTGSGTDCYGPGERSQGVEGFPNVEYKPCCDGKAAVDKPGDWGKFCPPVSADGRALLGEVCEVGVDSCADGNVCDFGYVLTDPENPNEETPVWLCRTVPRVGDRCLFANALTPPSFEPGRTCPRSANEVFCNFANICEEYPKVGEECLGTRRGLGNCAPGQTCVEAGDGTNRCVAS